MDYPYLNTMSQSESMTETFIGYDHNLRISDGAMWDMQNLTSDYYPLLANRGPRKEIVQLAEGHGLLGKESLAWVDERKLFWGGEDVSEALRSHGVVLENGKKQLLSMGAYIIILPDKAYYNTADPDDCGMIEAEWTNEYPVTASMCMADGSGFEYTVSATAPENPSNGDYWLKTQDDKDALYTWTTDQWTGVATVYCKLQGYGIDNKFKDDDGVNISGFSGESLNGSHILYGQGEDYIIIVGSCRNAETLQAGQLTITRKMPDMDYVIECQNRLWGCKYGTVGGKQINEIYCCKLGDFKNWEYYAGISMDSYRASCGTDGAWTGAVNYLGYPMFFKADCLHKVYVSAEGAHQIDSVPCRGVAPGCSESLAIVDNQLVYAGMDGMCAYDGSLPTAIGQVLGKELFRDAIAASFRNKYYVSMRGSESGWCLFAFDVSKGIWCKEDDTQVKAMARCADALYAIDMDDKIISLAGEAEGKEEDELQWSATTGIIGYTDANHKYVSRFVIRMKLDNGATARFDIEYDSSGAWRSCGNVRGNGLRSTVLPIRPVRCDHFRIRIQGKGNVRIYSVSRMYERGSDICGYK